MIKIYADFNSIEPYPFDENMLCLDLTSYGTLASLSYYQISMQIGNTFTFVDPDGLTVTATVFFDSSKISTICSGWFAKFESDNIIQGAPLAHYNDLHLCFHCRKNTKPYLMRVGQQFKEHCPFCGTAVMTPLLPPTNI